MVSKLFSHQRIQSLVTEFILREKNLRVSVSLLVPSVMFNHPLLDAVPLPQLNPKKKIFETVQPGTYFNPFDTFLLTLKIGFITLESREAAWVNPVTNSVHKIRTKNGVCVAPTFIGASLS